MRKSVFLGDLPRGRRFYYDGKPLKVARQLGGSGTVVRADVKQQVTIGDRSFTARRTELPIWSAGTVVEIDVRKGVGRAAG